MIKTNKKLKRLGKIFNQISKDLIKKIEIFIVSNWKCKLW